MAFKKITLNEDHLRLISNFRFGEISDWNSVGILTDEGDVKTDFVEGKTYGLDLNNLYGGSYLLEDISYLIGKYDEHIEGTEEDPEGVDFPEETKEYMVGLHTYIIENIEDIEALVHQFTFKGGLTPGTYRSKNNTEIWERVN